MLNILVVDDSWLARRILVNILQEEGYKTDEAVNGIEALQKITECQPDCVMLDLVMPESDGFGILRMLREQIRSIPVIVVTADIQHTTRTRCLEMGAVAVVNKPPERATLLSALHDAETHSRNTLQ